VQLRFATNLTSAQYVSQRAWRSASLDRCPLHTDGDCGFKRNGSYGRKKPAGARVPCWYCPDGHKTFSLLADCLAAKLPGSLAEVEQALDSVEQEPSLEAAADRLRPNILLPGGLRWVRRRRQLVVAAIAELVTLLPELFGNCELTLSSVRSHLDTDQVLPTLRALGEAYLPKLPPPIGFGPRPWARASEKPKQHDSGPRAPPAGCY